MSPNPKPPTAAELRARCSRGGVAIAPSLLAADFARLEQEIRAIEKAGATLLHLDIMDGHFVPNLSFGVPVVEAIRRTTDLLLDVHLMLDNPANYVEPFRKAGADVLTVHAEVLDDPRPVLDQIRALGAAAGLSLNPPLAVERIEPFLEACDLILVMSVMPGFGGQSFQPVALEKLAWLRDHSDCHAVLEVDGGVNAQTIGPCAAAGAEWLVAGTAVFGADDYGPRLADLSQSAQASVAGAQASG
ncbi:ribulose-phosphate 3-epimerase [Botrimarina hoheduenensis]|uniref:Ribulose-phosphate 3-epimerase n=1 Tax=Botrimarina hoheduenensis TaxID=2528000 RepID=A0A5C5W8Q2_9BACT|nr:ribulose-phosphate 3-epimerase [Botrimarina hoheduenensis]TWT46643.1 Ribulose-phosphate 3-epimerase [Botrimarina hoheduenensis]